MSEIKPTYGVPNYDGIMNPAIFINLDKDDGTDEHDLYEAFYNGIKGLYDYLPQDYEVVDIHEYNSSNYERVLKVEINHRHILAVRERLIEADKLERANVRLKNNVARLEKKLAEVEGGE